MKTTHIIFAILLTAGTAAFAQVEPAALGPKNPLPSGDLSYAARYSESAEFGQALGDYQSATLNADLNYSNGKEHHPLVLAYGGGYNWDISGPGYSTGLFQHLFVSQEYVWHKWNVTGSDDVSYRSQAPVIGFSGEPGTGEPIGVTNPAPPSSESVLTLNTHVVDNVVNGMGSHQIGYATRLTAGGGYEILRFPDGGGYNYQTDSANAGLDQRLNARNTLTGQYQFSLFTYPAFSYKLMTNSGLFGFRREWSRKISTDVSAGPQWTESPDSPTPPLQIGLAVNATATYKYHTQSASVSFVRGVNSGGGYLTGAESNAVTGNFSKDFGKNLSLGFTGSYRNTSGLDNSLPGQAANETITSEFGGVQATRRVGRYLSFFAGYTAVEQSTTTALSGNVLNGLQQFVNFGIGYSPRETHIKR